MRPQAAAHIWPALFSSRSARRARGIKLEGARCPDFVALPQQRLVAGKLVQCKPDVSRSFARRRLFFVKDPDLAGALP